MMEENKTFNTVLILSNSLFGLYGFRKEVVKALRDKGFNVCISVPEEDVKVDFFASVGCEIILTRFDRRGMNPLSDIKLMLSYYKLFKKLKPKVVLTYTIKPNIYGGMAARLYHVPQLANITGFGDAVENGGWLQKISVGLYKIGLSKARCVFFQNESNRSFGINMGIANENSILLPGSGVNLNHHAFQEYPVDDGKIVFLYIGRLMKDKGADELFETARTIKNRYPQTEFRVVGTVEGNYQKQLDELIEGGIVVFLGEHIDVRPFLGAAHCTIMPSYHEGMSNVNLESAANGRPVITTNVPGCRETVDDGRSGYLVDVRSVDSLIAAVERFIELPYNQKALMGVEGRKKMEKEFDRQIVVDSYLKEIKQIENV